MIIRPTIQRKFRQMIRLFEINERKVCPNPGDDLNVENDTNAYEFFHFLKNPIISILVGPRPRRASGSGY